MARRLSFLFIVLVLLGGASASGIAGAAEHKFPLRVMVSILPQEYFANRIGGDRIQVETLVQPGHSPATYAPTPKQMAALANATVYFRIGVPFENALIPKLARAIPHLTVIDLRRGIALLPVEESPTDHEDEDGHDHGDLDPHIWLDPLIALQIAETIRDAFINMDPDGEPEFHANFSDLAGDLTRLDRELRESLKPLAGQTIYVFHPAYGYFCRAYGLRQKAVNPHGKDPGASYLARLIEEARRDNIRVIFTQPQFSEKAARTLARSIGGRVVPLDPLAGDYLANMRAIARQLASSLPQ